MTPTIKQAIRSNKNKCKQADKLKKNKDSDSDSDPYGVRIQIFTGIKWFAF
jgi:hypothetical protein